MNEIDLLKSFLGGFPNSDNSIDRERFVKYAIACIKNNHLPDLKALKDKGLSEERVEEYSIAFEWIRDTYDYLLTTIA